MSATQSDGTDLNHGLIIVNAGEFADAELLVEFAVEAEEAGWDGVFFGDHLIYPPTANAGEYWEFFDPWITFAGIATHTEEIKLGTSVTPVPRRQPWQLARDLATLDHLSDGRVILGAGLGTPPDFTRFGREYDTQQLGEQFDEALEVIDGLWRGEPFSYDGEYYTIDEATLLPTPVQEPRIPIVIGGWWPFKASFHRGARWDGIVPWWPSLTPEAGEPEGEETPHHIEVALDHQKGHEAEVREMLEYYHGITDDPGEILLPTNAFGTPPDFVDTCRELGATWVLNRGVDASNSRSENLALIQDGPDEN